MSRRLTGLEGKSIMQVSAARRLDDPHVMIIMLGRGSGQDVSSSVLNISKDRYREHGANNAAFPYLMAIMYRGKCPQYYQHYYLGEISLGE